LLSEKGDKKRKDLAFVADFCRNFRNESYSNMVHRHNPLL